MIYYSNAIFLALVSSSVACYKDHWLRSFSKDDTLCPLLNGRPFVGGLFVGSNRSIQRLIDRRLHTCWPECAQESGEQEKERDSEDRKEAGRGSTWWTNYTGEWRDAFARGWKVSSGFRSLFLYIRGSNWQEKRSRRACDYPSDSNRLHVLCACRADFCVTWHDSASSRSFFLSSVGRVTAKLNARSSLRLQKAWKNHFTKNISYILRDVFRKRWRIRSEHSRARENGN